MAVTYTEKSQSFMLLEKGVISMPIATTVYTDGASAAPCDHYKITQGESYDIPVDLSLYEEHDGEMVYTPFTSEDVALLESLTFTIGKCFPPKTVPADEAWDDETGAFLFHLDQFDTLRMRPGVYLFKVDVMWANGDVISNMSEDDAGADKRVFVHVIENNRREVI